jgi:hypothetical protein
VPVRNTAVITTDLELEVKCSNGLYDEFHHLLLAAGQSLTTICIHVAIIMLTSRVGLVFNPGYAPNSTRLIDPD